MACPRNEKKKASIPTQMQIDHILASLPTSTANLNVQNSDGISNPEGSKKHPSVVHSLQILPYGLWMYSSKTRVGQSRIIKRGQRFRGLSVPVPDVTERLPTDQETKVPDVAFQTWTVLTILDHPSAVTHSNAGISIELAHSSLCLYQGYFLHS